MARKRRRRHEVDVTQNPRNSAWRRPGAVLLVSCYELGHQPHGVTLPKAFLERAGFSPDVMDLSVEDFNAARVQRARFVAISVPMHTALRLGESVARRVRDTEPEAHICFHGHYALLHGPALLRDGLADSVLGGELEQELVEQLEALAGGSARVERRTRPVLAKLDFPVPSRSGLPGLECYAHLVHGDTHVVAGYAEATRGCLYRCRHCPIPAVYDGRLFVVPVDVVLEDVRQQVRAGARHITFGDADFLNGPSHALRLASALHQEFPEVTFDFTAKVEHILEHAAVVRQLAEYGALFMVSAVECLNDDVLAILDKGHTRRDVDAALAVARDAGIALRPSLLPFTPWSTLQDFVDLLDWVEREDLVEHVDPVHFTIRLLVPPGSLLLTHPEMQLHLGDLDRQNLTYAWRHPDPEMDTLQAELAQVVEASVLRKDEAHETFELVRAHVDGLCGVATATAGRTTHKTPRRRRQRPPRLTESWFC